MGWPPQPIWWSAARHQSRPPEGAPPAREWTWTPVSLRVLASIGAQRHLPDPQSSAERVVLDATFEVE
jgi:hypothetical protein